MSTASLRSMSSKCPEKVVVQTNQEVYKVSVGVDCYSNAVKQDLFDFSLVEEKRMMMSGLIK